MASYVQVWSEEKKRHILVPRDEYSRPSRHASWQVMPDLPEYHSPIDNRLVSGRVQRREDLKRNGCRPYEQGERQDAIRRREQQHNELVRDINETARQIINERM